MLYKMIRSKQFVNQWDVLKLYLFIFFFVTKWRNNIYRKDLIFDINTV